MKMQNNLWADEELSRMLEELGCKSQFKFVWSQCNGSIILQHWDYYNKALDKCDVLGTAYHFSDLLIPENSVKIWPGYLGAERDYGMQSMEYENKVRQLTGMIAYRHRFTTNWQSFLKQEVEKALKIKSGNI